MSEASTLEVSTLNVSPKVDDKNKKPDSLQDKLNFLLEIDKLKNIQRRVYISDNSRRENSAEHSWHLAMALWFLSEHTGIKINIEHALKMALIHDICEIDPGDVSVFDKNREHKHEKEATCIKRLSAISPGIGESVTALWEEYEENQSMESKWVKISDRIVPFIMNLSSEGKAWIEQGITKSQVIGINQTIKEHFPELFEWFLEKIEFSVQQGWLIDE